MPVRRRGAHESERATSEDTGHGGDPVDPPDRGVEPGRTSRRRLLFVSGSLLVGGALANPVAAADANHYEIGARTSHWEGEEPGEIAGRENPTIAFTVGEEYTLTWHNRDGNFHKLLIRDEDNNVLARSAGNNEEGGTESVTVVATDEMDNYRCEPHYSMRGDIDTREDSSSTPTETDPQTRTETSSPTGTGTQTATDASTATDTETTSGTASETSPRTSTGTAAETVTSTDAGRTARTGDGSGTETASNGDEPDDQGVFGVGSVLAGLGGVGYLLRRRFRSADD